MSCKIRQTLKILRTSGSKWIKNLSVYMTYSPLTFKWHRGVVVITAQLHSTKTELRFCAGSNPACDVSEIRDGEDL